MRKLFFLAVLALLSSVAVSQEMPQLPKDPAILYGTLPNGLTYYVRQNAEPKGQAEFYIAQKVGSMQEEDNQLGLAHFLEHMCFNGTTHFPGKNLINYLESIGVQFGRNLNAYTSFDQTVYNISAVPVSREGIIDSCLLVLHDWSSDLLLEDKEIDAERGVIHEEWRTGNAIQRIYTNLLPQVYPNNRYGNRMPIGTMEVVDNFPYQTLRDYYHTWYRPDLQAVLVVGDIDPKQIVEKIKKTFADIPKPKKAKKREYFQVEDNKEPIVGMASDKEMPTNQIMLMWKSDVMEPKMKSTPMYFMSKYTEAAISQMLNMRIAELMQKGEPPFLDARLAFGEYLVSKTKDATTYAIAYPDGGLDRALAAAYTELLRAARHGFTVGEYMRFYENYMRMYEQAYTERDKRTSNEYVEEYVRNFLNDEPIPGIEVEYQLINAIAPNLPLDAINQMVKENLVTDENFVIALMNTATDTPTTKERILAIIDSVKNCDIEAYVDEVIDRPLLATIPTEGCIVKEEEGAFGSQVLTLNNGVRVVMRNTDFQADEILLTAYRNGGTGIFEDSDVEQLEWIDTMHGIVGMGDFSAIDLQKVLAGKHVSVSASLGENAEALSGNASVRDLETMLQLTTLCFSPMRTDDEACNAFRKRARQALEMQAADPMTAFRDSITWTMAKNKSRVVFAKPELVDRMSFDRIKQIYDCRFDHADNFTFFFVGNLEGDSVKTKIAQYLGSLPVKGVEDKAVNRDKGDGRGVAENQFSRDLEQEVSTVCMGWRGDMEFNMKNDIMMDIFVGAVDKVLLEKMREEAGATYSPQVMGGVTPTVFGDEASFMVIFQTGPDMRDRLIDMARTEIARVLAEGIADEQIAKSRQLLIKNYKEAQRKNSAMSSYLTYYYKYGKDVMTDYLQTVLDVTSDEVCAFARKFFDQNNRMVVSISPEKK